MTFKADVLHVPLATTHCSILVKAAAMFLQAQAAGPGAADEAPADQPAPAEPAAQNDAEPEPPDPPEQGDDPELEEEEGVAAEDADPNNGAQGQSKFIS